MNDTQKMLQAIINGQSTIEQELLGKIGEIDQKFNKLGGKVDQLDKKLDKIEKNLTGRIDGIGKQLAYLEDDAPTREELDKLSIRVD